MTKKEILESLGYDPDNPQDVQKFYAQYPTEESFQMAMGGMVDEYKKGGWIQKATASIKRRGTEGVCTGSKFGGPTCRPGTKRYNLAKTFRKMAKSRKEEGGYVDMYEDGGQIPDEVLRSRLESHMSPEEATQYLAKREDGGMVDSYGSGGYTVRRSNDRKGKTHVVIGPDGTKKYFGDPKLGERGKSKYGKEAFYKRHAKNLKNNPYFRAYARATWEDGGMVNSYGDGGQLPVDLLEARMKASGASQNEINAYKAQHYGQGGMVDVYQLMGMPTPSMYAMGGDVMMEDYARGGMIKRKDGSYSRRGLWDNIRANRGSGKKPTAEMLKQERKIRAAEKKEYGGMVNMYGMGGTTNMSHVISAKNFPNMGYAMGGPVMYDFGSVVKDIGAGAYGVGAGMVNTLSMGLATPYTNKGYELLQDLGGSTEAEKRQQDSVKGYGTTAGAITMGFLNPLTASSAVKTGAEGLGQGISKGSPDSQLAQSMGTLLPMAGNAAGMVGGQMSVPSVPQAAMGGQVNYPEGYQKNITFARGGMTGPLTEINVEKGELLTDKDGKIVTEYRGGGMVPHPEEGMDERGTVPAQEGQFVIPTKYAESYKAAMKNNDGLLAKAIRRRVVVEKAKNEAKDAQIAMAEEQKAAKAMNRMAAKYGGAIKRMFAKGGMVPMYDGGSTVLNTSAPSNWSWGNPQPVLPLENPGVYASLPQFMGTSTISGSSFGSTPTDPFDISLPLQPMQPRPIDPSSVKPAIPPASPQGVYIGPGSRYYTGMPTQTFDVFDITGFDSGQYPNKVPYRIEAGESWPGTAASKTDASKTDGSPGGGGDMSNFDEYAPYVMQGLPIAWNLIQSMKKPTKVPGTLGAMSTALEAPKMSGEAGRRALAREGAAARYAWRQAGAQAGPAALTALTNARMGRIADFEEGLRNAQAQMDYQAAAQRKAYEQFNAQQAMNRYMLQSQADAVPTQYASKGMEQFGQMGESMLNRQLLKQLEG